MLQGFLSEAVAHLERLIELTKQDIEDIKLANHEAIFARLDTKNATLESFEKAKDSARDEMLRISQQNPNKNIGEMLDSQTAMLIDAMREGLKTLREVNRQYARSVAAVYEFYNSLVESIIPSQRNGYSKASYSTIDVLHIEA